MRRTSGRRRADACGSRRRTPHRPLAGLAHALGRPPESIHVIARRTSAARSGARARRRPRSWSRRPRAIELGRPGQVGRGPAPRTSSPPTRGAAWRARSSWRSTPTGACSASARGSSPTSAPTCSRRPPCRRTRWAMLMTGGYDDRRRRRRGRRRAHATRCRPARCAAPGARRRAACSSARSTRRRASSASTRSSCGAATSSRAFPHETPLGFTLRLRRLRALPGPGARAGRAERRPAASGSGVALYVERAGGQFGRARRSTRDDDGRVVVRSELVPARPGPRHDVRADRRRPARHPIRATSSCGSATAPRRRPASARSAAARPRWRGSAVAARAARPRSARAASGPPRGAARFESATGVRLRRVRGGRRDRRETGAPARPPDRRGRRRGHDHQPAARRGPGARRARSTGSAPC